MSSIGDVGAGTSGPVSLSSAASTESKESPSGRLNNELNQADSTPEESGAGGETVELSGLLGSAQTGGNTESFSFGKDEGASSSYNAEGGVDESGDGGEIDAMI